jgi:hypothetical protein
VFEVDKKEGHEAKLNLRNRKIQALIVVLVLAIVVSLTIVLSNKPVLTSPSEFLNTCTITGGQIKEPASCPETAPDCKEQWSICLCTARNFTEYKNVRYEAWLGCAK